MVQDLKVKELQSRVAVTESDNVDTIIKVSDTTLWSNASRETGNGETVQLKPIEGLWRFMALPEW